MRVYDKEFKEEAIKLSYEIGIRRPQNSWGYQKPRYTRGEAGQNSMEQ